MKYLIIAAISLLALNVNAAPVGECEGTPASAVMILPEPLNAWGQIICTKYGHIIANKDGWIWSNAGGFRPVMIPSQMVRYAPQSVGNESYFTQIEMQVLSGVDAQKSIEILESSFDKSSSIPKVYSLQVASISGKTLKLNFFDYGDSKWGMWCNKECKPDSSFMLLNMSE